MKKLIIISLLLFCLLLSSCNFNDSTNLIPSSSDAQYTDYSLYFTAGFQDLIDNNPIDAEYGVIEYTGSTTEYIEKESHYRDLWKAEMENTYQLLLSVLNDEDKESLKKSQDGWSEYMSGNSELQISCFYEHSYNFNTGQDQKMFAMYHQSTLTRDRALELMEYLFLITGEIDFVYEKQTE